MNQSIRFIDSDIILKRISFLLLCVAMKRIQFSLTDLFCRENFGYISQKWKDPPSQDLKFVRKRAMQMNITLQCGKD